MDVVAGAEAVVVLVVVKVAVVVAVVTVMIAAFAVAAIVLVTHIVKNVCIFVLIGFITMPWLFYHY